MKNFDVESCLELILFALSRPEDLALGAENRDGGKEGLSMNEGRGVREGGLVIDHSFLGTLQASMYSWMRLLVSEV